MMPKAQHDAQHDATMARFEGENHFFVDIDGESDTIWGKENTSAWQC